MTRRQIRIGVGVLIACVALLAWATTVMADGPTLTDQQKLGKKLFFDKNLSLNNNQACAACHAPAVGWTGPDQKINKSGGVYEGSIPGAFGNRKPPSAAYGGDSPILHQDKSGNWVGGMFWDGRATGARLHDPLAEQAQGPFLNPKEQALPNAEAVIAKVRASSYADLFAQKCKFAITQKLYDCIGRAIAAYESSREVGPFTSKYDYYLKGKAKLTEQELRGLELFNGKAKCSGCHVSKGPRPFFTDFTYDNLGIPKNPENPVYKYDPNFVDLGLGVTVNDANQNGKFKVPTLRNVDLRPSNKFVKAYGHNAYFKSLEEIVHFYNTRDVGDWPPPEVPANVNKTELGNLGLTRGEEKAIVAFLKTLSDGYERDED